MIMSVEGWKYYNHAMVPTCAPHESANIEAMRDKDFWNPIGGVHRSLLDGQKTGIVRKQSFGIRYLTTPLISKL